MADREISYALRVICSEPGVLSPHDRDRLLTVLLGDVSENDFRESLCELPIGKTQLLRNATDRFIRQYQKTVEFKIGDELVEAVRPALWGVDKPGGMVRRGKLLHITKEMVHNGTGGQRPYDVFINGIWYISRVYIGCIGPEWDTYRIGTVNHQWVDRYLDMDGYLPEDIKTILRASGCKKILSALESTFRSSWYRAQDYDDSLSQFLRLPIEEEEYEHI